LVEKINKQTGSSETNFQFFPKTKYGPLVNLGFADGKVEGYRFDQETNSFVFPNVDYMILYNPKNDRIKGFDPFNYQPNQPEVYFDPQGNLVEINR